MKKVKKLFKKSKGFTLIEMLVVVLIIGILAAIALPQYRKTVIKTRLAEADIAMNIMKKNVELFFLKNSHLLEIGEGETFTGKDALPVEFEQPGDCSSSWSFCKTDYFGFISGNGEYLPGGCSATVVGFDTNQATNNTTWLNGAIVLVAKDYRDINNPWYICTVATGNASTKKLICKWLQERNYNDPDGVCD